MPFSLKSHHFALALFGLAIGETIIDQVFSGRANRPLVAEAGEYKWKKKRDFA